MKEIQIAICDDDILVVDMIKNRSLQILGNTEQYSIFKTTSTKELMNYCTCNHIDILLIDIEMPELSGFKFVEWLSEYNQDVIIIFITNIDIYVYESFKYHAFRFIRKSYLDELDEALHSAIKKITEKWEIYTVKVTPHLSFEVNVGDIIYFESMHNNVKIVTTQGENIFRATLKSIEAELNNSNFIRIYSSIIVNIKYIYKINTKNLEVIVLIKDRKISLPVSRNKLKKLVDQYKIYLR